MEVDEEDFLLLSDIVDVVGVQVLEITTVKEKGSDESESGRSQSQRRVDETNLAIAFFAKADMAVRLLAPVCSYF